MCVIVWFSFSSSVFAEWAVWNSSINPCDSYTNLGGYGSQPITRCDSNHSLLWQTPFGIGQTYCIGMYNQCKIDNLYFSWNYQYNSFSSWFSLSAFNTVNFSNGTGGLNFVYPALYSSQFGWHTSTVGRIQSGAVSYFFPLFSNQKTSVNFGVASYAGQDSSTYCTFSQNWTGVVFCGYSWNSSTTTKVWDFRASEKWLVDDYAFISSGSIHSSWAFTGLSFTYNSLQTKYNGLWKITRCVNAPSYVNTSVFTSPFNGLQSNLDSICGANYNGTVVQKNGVVVSTTSTWLYLWLSDTSYTGSSYMINAYKKSNGCLLSLVVPKDSVVYSYYVGDNCQYSDLLSFQNLPYGSNAFWTGIVKITPLLWTALGSSDWVFSLQNANGYNIYNPFSMMGLVASQNVSSMETSPVVTFQLLGSSGGLSVPPVYVSPYTLLSYSWFYQGNDWSINYLKLKDFSFSAGSEIFISTSSGVINSNSIGRYFDSFSNEQFWYFLSWSWYFYGLNWLGLQTWQDYYFFSKNSAWDSLYLWSVENAFFPTSAWEFPYLWSSQNDESVQELLNQIDTAQNWNSRIVQNADFVCSYDTVLSLYTWSSLQVDWYSTGISLPYSLFWSVSARDVSVWLTPVYDLDQKVFCWYMSWSTLFRYPVAIIGTSFNSFNDCYKTGAIASTFSSYIQCGGVSSFPVTANWSKQFSYYEEAPRKSVSDTLLSKESLIGTSCDVYSPLATSSIWKTFALSSYFSGVFLLEYIAVPIDVVFSFITKPVVSVFSITEVIFSLPEDSVVCLGWSYVQFNYGYAWSDNKQPVTNIKLSNMKDYDLYSSPFFSFLFLFVAFGFFLFVMKLFSTPNK